ncbi:hypothetical protein ABGV42_01035 [Paenibacillus pabuli]|uniref:hypothetical protein n=1 Tax=Paenibacillus pabuli TaxID=1472 RepID=UPI0032425586
MKIDLQHIELTNHRIMFVVAATFSRSAGSEDFRPGEAIGYAVMNKETENLKIITSDEAINLAHRRYSEYQAGKSETPLYYENALAIVRTFRNTDYNLLIGLDGRRPYTEETVADLTGSRRWNYADYSSAKVQETAYQLARDILQGKYSTTPAMDELLARWKAQELRKMGYNQNS